MTFTRPWTSRRLVSFVTVLVVLLCSGPTFSQNPPEGASKTPAIITYLTETINWYRGTVVEQQIANEPIDITFADDNRRISGQIVRLAFDFARLEEQRQSRQPKGTQTQDQAAAPLPKSTLDPGDGQSRSTSRAIPKRTAIASTKDGDHSEKNAPGS